MTVKRAIDNKINRSLTIVGFCLGLFLTMMTPGLGDAVSDRVYRIAWSYGVRMGDFRMESVGGGDDPWNYWS